MQRSSEGIGTIAAALAKAQAQLVNPEKSLVATIRSDGPRGTEQSFRYAPLSSGLDIVRKTLSQRSRPCKPLRLTKRSESFDSVLFLRMPPENGLPRIGRSARSETPQLRIGWVRR